MNPSDFYALLFRMKNINRWGLMRNTVNENLSEHSMEVAVIAHALALIGNRKFQRKHDAERIAVAALFHDMNEILTGDLPTPVKYYNDAIRTAYKAIEEHSCEKMLSLLEEELRPDYEALLSLSEAEHALIKCADRLCAYIKCRDELRRGNNDFASASQSVWEWLTACKQEELQYFIENYLPSFEKTLDQITL